jgi:hypothetical protein
MNEELKSQKAAGDGEVRPLNARVSGLLPENIYIYRLVKLLHMSN